MCAVFCGVSIFGAVPGRAKGLVAAPWWLAVVGSACAHVGGIRVWNPLNNSFEKQIIGDNWRVF